LVKSILEESKVVEVSNFIGNLAFNPLSIFMPVGITETIADLILTLKRRNKNGR
jgi:hypothetical protein